MKYNNNNIFAKVLREEIPCKKVYENEYVLAFHDINPQTKIHILVIPKGKYISFVSFLFLFKSLKKWMCITPAVPITFFNYESTSSSRSFQA